jgi:hypothetical protein
MWARRSSGCICGGSSKVLATQMQSIPTRTKFLVTFDDLLQGIQIFILTEESPAIESHCLGISQKTPFIHVCSAFQSTSAPKFLPLNGDLDL